MPIGLPEINVSPGLKPQAQSIANITSPTHRATRIAGMGTAPKTFDHIAVTNEQNSLVFPHDRPKYFMQFGIYDYARTSLMEMGTLEPWKGGSNQICLPLSEGLVDMMEARWEETPIGWIVGGAAEAIKGISQAENTAADIKRRGIDGAAAIAARLNMTPLEFAQRDPYGQRLVLDAGDIGSSIGALTGIAPNRFITILYIGPSYKQHSFQWNLSPRNKQESETLRRIVNVFKKAMSPTVRHYVLWGYPAVIRLMFRPNNEQLYKFRPMVIKKFNVNWTPMGGRAAFYNTRTPTPESFYGAPEEGNPPEGCTIQMTMVELEYHTQEKMSETPARATQLDQSQNW